MEDFLATPFLLFLTTSLLACYVINHVFKPRRTNERLPPSPPRLPILGNLHQLSPLTHRSFQLLGRKYGPIMLLHFGRLPILGNLHQLSPLTHRSFQLLGRKYGPIMLLHFGSRPVVLVQSSAAAAEIMKTNDLLFADKPESRTMRQLFYDLKDISIAPYGEYWRRLKSICILHLLSSKRVQSFQFIRKEETALLVKKIRASCSAHAPVNLSKLFSSLTNDVICRAALGRKYGEGEDGRMFLRILTEVMQLLGSMNIGEFVPWLRWIDSVTGFNRRVDRVAKEMDEFLEMVIQEHLKGTGSETSGANEENFVDILLNIYQDNTTGVSIDKDGIKAIILDILAGGTDTAATALEWAMTELLRHPNMLNRLQCEVGAILKDNNRDITNDDLDKMHYLKAVVKETLRCHPPIPFMARVARQDVKVMGYNIATGTMVIVNAWAIGRDPASWDEPEAFKPERFLNSSIDFRGLDFELTPFGAGRRGCPGIEFAIASIELVLANLMHKFEWGLPEGRKWEDLDTTEQPGVTIHRKNPLFAVATELHL